MSEFDPVNPEDPFSFERYSGAFKEKFGDQPSIVLAIRYIADSKDMTLFLKNRRKEHVLPFWRIEGHDAGTVAAAVLAEFAGLGGLDWVYDLQLYRGAQYDDGSLAVGLLGQGRELPDLTGAGEFKAVWLPSDRFEEQINNLF